MEENTVEAFLATYGHHRPIKNGGAKLLFVIVIYVLTMVVAVYVMMLYGISNHYLSMVAFGFVLIWVALWKRIFDAPIGEWLTLYWHNNVVGNTLVIELNYVHERWSFQLVRAPSENDNWEWCIQLPLGGWFNRARVPEGHRGRWRIVQINFTRGNVKLKSSGMLTVREPSSVWVRIEVMAELFCTGAMSLNWGEAIRGQQNLARQSKDYDNKNALLTEELGDLRGRFDQLVDETFQTLRELNDTRRFGRSPQAKAMKERVANALLTIIPEKDHRLSYVEQYMRKEEHSQTM